MKRSRLTRLERLERDADDFVDEVSDQMPPDQIARIVIYDPETGPPQREPGDVQPWFVCPDNGRGPDGFPVVRAPVLE